MSKLSRLFRYVVKLLTVVVVTNDDVVMLVMLSFFNRLSFI